MLITAPAFLSTPLANGYAVQKVDGASSHEMDARNTRRRPKFRNTPEIVTCAWLLTQAQYDEFDAWFEATIDVGAKAFELEILAQTKKTLFLEPPAAEVTEDLLYRVTAKLLRGPAGIRVLNMPPVITGPFTADIPYNATTAFTAAAILAACGVTDPDGDVVSLASIGAAGPDATVTLVGGVVSVTPLLGYLGLISIPFVVADTKGLSVAGAISLTSVYADEACIRLKLDTVNYVAPNGSALTLKLSNLGPYTAPQAAGCAI